jgi:hypothetical protein
MWRVYRDAGREWPAFSDDPVIDYMVMEAVALKAKKEEDKARKDAERAEWKKQQKEKLKQTVS